LPEIRDVPIPPIPNRRACFLRAFEPGQLGVYFLIRLLIGDEVPRVRCKERPAPR
jgi:hypothetical protein